MEPRIDIIICTYNNKNIIDKCLKSIFNQTYKNFKVFVIDDHSSDDIKGYLKKKYNKVICYKKDRNSGPSISRNIGIKLSKSRYIVFMDSDIELKKDWLKENIYLIENNKNIGILGSKLLYSRNKEIINSVGGNINRIGVGFDIGRGKKDEYFENKKFLYVCSAAMIVKKELIDKIGGFDDTFFYSYEDTDLGWRANLLGYDVVFNPKSIAYHDVNETIKNITSKVYFHGTKNRIRMLIKNYEIHNLIIYLPLLIIASLGDILIRKHRFAKIKGLFWNLINIKDSIKERKKIQALRTIKDNKIFNLFNNKLI